MNLLFDPVVRRSIPSLQRGVLVLTRNENSTEVLGVLSSCHCVLLLWITQYRSRIYSYRQALNTSTEGLDAGEVDQIHLASLILSPEGVSSPLQPLSINSLPRCTARYQTRYIPLFSMCVLTPP